MEVLITIPDTNYFVHSTRDNNGMAGRHAKRCNKMTLSVSNGSHAAILLDVEHTDRFIIRTTQHVFPIGVKADTANPVFMSHKHAKARSLRKKVINMSH
jgi:hypothetical protein